MTDLYVNVNRAGLKKIESAERESLGPAIEMLFFAYRDFTSEPDKILQEFGFGRAHHRVIYFVGRNPNLTISDLLVILKITKQSLNRVLRPLVKEGFIKKSIGPHDRRKRFLNLTEKGEMLEFRLTEIQRYRIANAYAAAGNSSVEGFKRVLLGIMTDDVDRRRFE